MLFWVSAARIKTNVMLSGYRVSSHIDVSPKLFSSFRRPRKFLFSDADETRNVSNEISLMKATTRYLKRRHIKILRSLTKATVFYHTCECVFQYISRPNINLFSIQVKILVNTDTYFTSYTASFIKTKRFNF